MTNKENFPTLSGYWTMLDYFDWYYQYSDDHAEWKTKHERHQQLKLISKQSPEKKELYDRFSKWIFSKEIPGTTPAPKPVQPVEVSQENIHG